MPFTQWLFGVLQVFVVIVTIIVFNARIQLLLGLRPCCTYRLLRYADVYQKQVPIPFLNPCLISKKIKTTYRAIG